jgi:hypothetical protein
MVAAAEAQIDPSDRRQITVQFVDSLAVSADELAERLKARLCAGLGRWLDEDPDPDLAWLDLRVIAVFLHLDLLDRALREG